MACKSPCSWCSLRRPAGLRDCRRIARHFCSGRPEKSLTRKLELRSFSDPPENRMNIHHNARLTPLGRERTVRAIVEGGQTPQAAARAAAGATARLGPFSNLKPDCSPGPLPVSLPATITPGGPGSPGRARRALHEAAETRKPVLTQPRLALNEFSEPNRECRECSLVFGSARRRQTRRVSCTAARPSPVRSRPPLWSDWDYRRTGRS